MHRENGLKIVIVFILIIGLAMPFFSVRSESADPIAVEQDCTEVSADSFSALYKLGLIRFYKKQISSAYESLLQSTHRDDFKGYCAMYANNLLVYFGINKTYIKGNANSLYSIYSPKSVTDNGFFVEEFPAKKYSLKEALSLFSCFEAPQEKFLVIFSQGATEKGKEFGHVFYVNGIIGDTVVFSESSPSFFSKNTVPEGEPLILTIDEVCEKYAYNKFEGIIHFSSLSEPPSFTDFWRGKTCRYEIPGSVFRH